MVSLTLSTLFSKESELGLNSAQRPERPAVVLSGGLITGGIRCDL